MTNSRSLLPKLDDLICSVTNLKPDVCICTETWIDDAILDSYLNIPLYEVLRDDRNRNGGGVCVWCNACLNPTVQYVDDKPERVNAVWFTIYDFIIGALYVPPDVSAMIETQNYLVNTCDALQSNYPEFHIAICGDFNSMNCDELCAQLDLFDAVVLPTRNLNKLDHILISNSLATAYKNAENLPPLMSSLTNSGVASDHHILHLKPVQDQHWLTNNPKFHRVFDFRESKVLKARNYLQSVNFRTLYYSTDVNEMCAILYQHLHEAISLIPVDVVTMTKRDKKWITPLVKLLINRRWNAWRSGNMDTFNHYKLKVSLEIYKAKLNWSNKAKSGVKGAWTVANDIRGKSAGCNMENLATDKTNTELISEITEKFLSNFNWHKQNPIEIPSVTNEPAFIIEQHTVYKQLIQLKKNKSAGSDNIASRFLCLFAEYICGPLCAIQNESLRSCVFPDVWKLQDTIPVPKCKRPTIDQLRPIALLPIMGKCLEKHVVSFYKNDLVNDYGQYQHAYRPNGSCTSALVEMHEKVTAWLDDNTTCAVRMIFFDMKAAFDKLRHDLVLARMIQCKLDPRFILWCQSYLGNRQLCVKLNNQRSVIHYCPSSVPQGSIIGPYLFAFFMGSLNLGHSFDPSNYHLIIYADDILLLERVTANDLSSHTSATGIIKKWCFENDLLLNDKKTVQLFVKKRSFTVPEEFAGILVSDSTKYLGVQIDSRLTFNTHIFDICKKASQRMYILRTLKPLVSKNELVVVFDALIMSIIRYSAPLFICLNKNCISLMNRILGRCHRIICNCTCYDCDFMRDASAVILEASCRFFNKIKCDVSHPLYKYMPKTLPRTNKFRIELWNSSRRQKSFFPSMAIKLNDNVM